MSKFIKVLTRTVHFDGKLILKIEQFDDNFTFEAMSHCSDFEPFFIKSSWSVCKNYFWNYFYAAINHISWELFLDSLDK